MSDQNDLKNTLSHRMTLCRTHGMSSLTNAVQSLGDAIDAAPISNVALIWNAEHSIKEVQTALKEFAKARELEALLRILIIEE